MRNFSNEHVNFVWIANRRLPFDWKNPIGYIFAAIIAYLMAVNLLKFAATTLSAGITAVLFTKAILNDLKNYLTEINQNGIVEKYQAQATKQFCEFIQIDTLSKQLSTHLCQTIRHIFKDV